jgi:tRNA1(Val) A37 N6-methylase TrmN6
VNEFPTTTDAFLGGQVMLVQPAENAHRSGSDAVFLAATLHGADGAILDMGAGAGAVGLMASHLNPQAKGGVGRARPADARLLRQVAGAQPSLAARMTVLEVDLHAPEPQRIACGLQRAAYDHVLSNPPYRKAGHVRTNRAKAAAHVVNETNWMAGCAPPPAC